MLLERIIPYHTIPYHIPLLPRDIIEIHSRKPAFGLFSSCLVSSKSQPCCCNAQCRLVLKCEKLLGSNCSVMDLVTDYWVNNFATSSPVLSDEQAPAGSRDSSRDPGLFWIPIPIPIKTWIGIKTGICLPLQICSKMFIFQKRSLW